MQPDVASQVLDPPVVVDTARAESETKPVGQACVAVGLPCLGCGYNLWRLGVHRHCPECGTAVERSLAPAELLFQHAETLRQSYLGILLIRLAPLSFFAIAGMLLLGQQLVVSNQTLLGYPLQHAHLTGLVLATAVVALLTANAQAHRLAQRINPAHQPLSELPELARPATRQRLAVHGFWASLTVSAGIVLAWLELPSAHCHDLDIAALILGPAFLLTAGLWEASHPPPASAADPAHPPRTSPLDQRRLCARLGLVMSLSGAATWISIAYASDDSVFGIDTDTQRRLAWATLGGLTAALLCVSSLLADILAALGQRTTSRLARLAGLCAVLLAGMLAAYELGLVNLRPMARQIAAGTWLTTVALTSSTALVFALTLGRSVRSFDELQSLSRKVGGDPAWNRDR